MLTPDHPNALWLRDLYNGGVEISREPTLTGEQVAERVAAHMVEMKKRMSPDIIIHTGGFLLAATGQGDDFIERYNKRRGSLCDSNVLPIEMDQFLADDFYGINHGKFRTSRNGEVWERIGMGAWRFEDGIAVEHWELSNAPKWDEFFMAGDPGFEGSAMEFWMKTG